MELELQSSVRLLQMSRYLRSGVLVVVDVSCFTPDLFRRAGQMIEMMDAIPYGCCTPYSQGRDFAESGGGCCGWEVK